jgi:hypothetical protein
VLNVLDPRLHYSLVSEPIQAGRRDVRLEVPPGDLALHRSLRGRVVTRRGDPVPGVTILPYIAPVSTREPVAGGTVDVSRFFEGESVRAGDDGTFELVDVPRRHVSFLLTGEHVGYAFASVEDVEDPRDHRFVVAARVRVEIELLDPSCADAARATDDSGGTMDFVDARADGSSIYARLVLAIGRSGLVALSSDATTIVLAKSGEVVESIPVRLVPGEVARIVR